MSQTNKKLGLRAGARSPSAIQNAEHHDPSRAQKNLDGIPGQIKTITNDAVEHTVDDFSIIRVANTTGGTIYLWVGAAGTDPVVDQNNGIAILAGTSELVHCGAIDEKTSVAYKLSGAAQVVVFEQ